MTATDELRDKCRTCRFLALPEGNISSGYCWQCDMPVKLMTYESFPKGYDPRCSDIHGEESVWEPLAVLAPYFEEGTDHD